MKLNENFFYTLRENVKDEETISGNLLVRSGMVKKVSAGIYMYMPLGLQTMKKIEKVIRKHMDNAGANELLMPNLLPEEVYINSGRRDKFGTEMFSLKDRNNRDLVLGPTHEEFFVEAAKMRVKSYKDLPFNIYQIGNKYRDEKRPRFGLIRVREFFMKDAYSFDKDSEGVDKSYNKMMKAYKDIFDELKIEYKIVTADTGAMGGLLSEEFQAVTDRGEDILVLCDCGYSSNLEVSKSVITKEEIEELKAKEEIYTPNCKTIKDIADFLKVDAKKIVKTLVYKSDDKFYAVLISGEKEVNETKLSKLLNVSNLELASNEEVEEITNSKTGFAGPININIPIVIDEDIEYKYNYVVGANKTDYHIKNVNTNNFEYVYKGDIKLVQENDLCPECQNKLYFKKGIEIGNLFKLGTKYSELGDLKYTDEFNKPQLVDIGCYGIGVGRVLAAYIEQHNDDKGIVFNKNIAPYQISIVLIDRKNEEQVKVANELYDQLKEKYDVILDDRDERAGVKFKDMDLIGIPLRITVGKKANEGLVEFKVRTDEESKDINISEIEECINNNL